MSDIEYHENGCFIWVRRSANSWCRIWSTKRECAVCGTGKAE